MKIKITLIVICVLLLTPAGVSGTTIKITSEEIRLTDMYVSPEAVHLYGKYSYYLQADKGDTSKNEITNTQFTSTVSSFLMGYSGKVVLSVNYPPFFEIYTRDGVELNSVYTIDYEIDEGDPYPTGTVVFSPEFGKVYIGLTTRSELFRFDMTTMKGENLGVSFNTSYLQYAEVYNESSLFILYQDMTLDLYNVETGVHQLINTTGLIESTRIFSVAYKMGLVLITKDSENFYTYFLAKGSNVWVKKASFPINMDTTKFFDEGTSLTRDVDSVTVTELLKTKDYSHTTLSFKTISLLSGEVVGDGEHTFQGELAGISHYGKMAFLYTNNEGTYIYNPFNYSLASLDVPEVIIYYPLLIGGSVVTVLILILINIKKKKQK